MPPVQSKPSNNSIDLRRSTVAIESNFVSSSSKGTYNSKLVLFALWLFDNDHREFLDDELLPLMIQEDCVDEATFKKRMERFEAGTNKQTNSNQRGQKKSKRGN
jgi:hypothetical protein